jgi:release factor glutamine methyltransferase
VPVTASAAQWADLIGRLRAAGCVFAEDEAHLLLAAADDLPGLAAMVERRAIGHPLEQVLGWAEFCGLRIAVEPGVFVPRRRSEFLVRHAVHLAGAPDSPAADLVLLELCCGSAAIGLAAGRQLADAGHRVRLHAGDLDPVAVRCARHNLVALADGERLVACLHQGDLFGPVPSGLQGRVSLLLANTPYVPTGELPLLPAEARLHEPRLALDGGTDGLHLLRRIAAEAIGWLAPGGRLLIEISARQGPEASRAFEAGGLRPELAHCDQLGATVVVGLRPGTRQRPVAGPPVTSR